LLNQGGDRDLQKLSDPPNGSLNAPSEIKSVYTLKLAQRVPETYSLDW
jgi:hypothetical protein